jgi:AcrR family transcriptional regulator
MPPQAATPEAATPEVTPRPTDRRRVIADRNVHAILDAAEELLRKHAPVNIAAVARQAGGSRVTVYAHFATGEALLEAVVERAVGHAAAALAAAEPETGPPLEALTRQWRWAGANWAAKPPWRRQPRHGSAGRPWPGPTTPPASQWRNW